MTDRGGKYRFPTSVDYLRTEAGCGILDARKALAEADGDPARALEILRAKQLRGDRSMEYLNLPATLRVDVMPGDRVVTVRMLTETEYTAGRVEVREFAKALARAVDEKGRVPGVWGGKLTDLSREMREDVRIASVATSDNASYEAALTALKMDIALLVEALEATLEYGEQRFAAWWPEEHAGDRCAVALADVAPVIRRYVEPSVGHNLIPDWALDHPDQEADDG